MYAYFCYIFPYKMRQRRQRSFVNQMKNYLKADLIGFSQAQLATNKLGTWLGPVILYILLKKYDFDVAQSHPYLSHSYQTFILQVGLKYYLIIFFVMYPQIFFLQSHGFFIRIFFSFGLKILGNSCCSICVGLYGKMSGLQPQLGALISSPKMESLDFCRGSQSTGTIRCYCDSSRLNQCYCDILLLY